MKGACRSVIPVVRYRNSLEPGHHVFGLNDADGEMAVDPDVQAASGGQGKRVLGGKERATECTIGERDLVGVRASKQNLGKGSNPVVLPERKARAEEIA
jgi:hypothetical protein